MPIVMRPRAVLGLLSPATAAVAHYLLWSWFMERADAYDREIAVFADQVFRTAKAA